MFALHKTTSRGVLHPMSLYDMKLRGLVIEGHSKVEQVVERVTE